MDQELLRKYCRNSCNEEELVEVLDWFERYAGTSEGKSFLLKIWEDVKDDEGELNSDFDLMLGKIHHKINLAQTSKLLQKSDQSLVNYSKRKFIVTFLTKAAAILLIPVLVFGLYMSQKYLRIKRSQVSVSQAYNEVFSSVDAITKVTLPDGSNIWLNHSSSLRYPSVFVGDTRRVELKGEGFFEVASNPDKPFIVTAENLQVKAVGTSFNVMAYPDESGIETTLITGKVELQRVESDGKITRMGKMKPNDMAVFQKSNDKVVISTIDDDRYFSWKVGKLVFNGTPMDEVARKLSRWFNVDIQIKDPRLLEITYTATFVHETLPQVMELIALMSPLSYSISEREEISKGTFAKRKIILNYRNK
jgi:transmembrane sensor